MNEKPVRYRPKGSMCWNCQYNVEDCSHLDFASMRPLRVDKDGTVVVRCTKYAPYPPRPKATS